VSAFIVLLLASSIPSLASLGDCGWVHGRYGVANGSMIHRIWIIGTHHELNLDVPDEATPLKRFLGSSEYDPTANRLIGEFYVCARERRVAGHMQRVHLERAKALRIVK
jgi:hypothetical protein